MFKLRIKYVLRHGSHYAFVERMVGDSNQQSNDIYDACIKMVNACIYSHLPFIHRYGFIVGITNEAGLVIPKTYVR